MSSLPRTGTASGLPLTDSTRRWSIQGEVRTWGLLWSLLWSLLAVVEVVEESQDLGQHWHPQGTGTKVCLMNQHPTRRNLVLLLLHIGPGNNQGSGTHPDLWPCFAP